MRVIITGANSYFGSNLSNFLKKKRIQIVKINHSKNFDIEKNIFNYRSKIKNHDYFIYLAHDYSKYSVKNNINTLKKINHKNKNKVKKIIYISSMSAHKNNLSRYGKSKFEIEKFCVKEKILIIRPGYIFGGKNNFKHKKIVKVLNLFPIIPLYKNYNNFIYSVEVNELCNEIYKILKLKKITYQSFNIFNKKKIYFDYFLKNLSNKSKLYFNINYKIYLIFIKVINKILNNKFCDSLLSFMSAKKKFSQSTKVKNIYTENSII